MFKKRKNLHLLLLGYSLHAHVLLSSGATALSLSQRPSQPLGFMKGNSTAHFLAQHPSAHPAASASSPKDLESTILQQQPKINDVFLMEWPVLFALSSPGCNHCCLLCSHSRLHLMAPRVTIAQ